jgi:ribosome-associated heat shock protein Hsp15
VRPESGPPPVRLDIWLDVACVYKTRSEAQKACNGGKVEVNGQRARPHRLLRIGDEVKLTRGPGRRQVLVVASLASQHLPKADARLLYADTTPPLTPAELALRELERSFWRQHVPQRKTAPDRRERRERRREKEQEF